MMKFAARERFGRLSRAQQDAQIGEQIRELESSGAEPAYPLDSELELAGKVKIGDRMRAQEVLNSILGAVLFNSMGDFATVRARVLELLSVLSRAALKGGADAEIMLERNLGYVNKMMQTGDPGDLCALMSEALEEYLDLVYSSQDGGRAGQVQPAVDYIESNYTEPMTLAQIAKAAHLSVSRLAHVFKEQMGLTIIDYLTSVRIERAKHLLLSTSRHCTEICSEVGYANQSYFTRAFKGAVGMTPSEFRSRNRRKTVPARLN